MLTSLVGRGLRGLKCPTLIVLTKTKAMKKTLLISTMLLMSLISVSQTTETIMSKAVQQTIDDAEDRYYIAMYANDQMDKYVQAGLVAAAYLYAKDEKNYLKWKETQSRAAKALGIEQ